jgi:EAL and modified HD-GYP domain-containing signal transduction protein
VAALVAKPAAKAGSVMRREAMLGRNQKVAAYTFMLRRAMDDQRDSNLPDMQRLYDETLLGNLQRMDIARLLGQRQAFVPIAPASLDLPLIDGWPAAGTVLLNIIAQPIDEPLLAPG